MKFAAALLLLVAQDEPRFFDPAVHEATRTFAYEDFRIVPVRVHRLRCKDAAALDCNLEEADVRRVFEKANRIWNKAGLALAIESITREDAVQGPEFEDSKLDSYKATRPEATRPAGMIHVYYVHELPTNGVFMGRDAIFVKDTAALRKVRGGVDEPLPRVTSHEIGHAMGLPHRQNTINLMASGTTGWSVSDDEIDAVREWAAQQAWVLSPAAALEKGYCDLLSSLPGESPVKEQARAALEKSKRR
ncbi:MAG TPA: Matrixin [Planctomycetota bacterium]|nr:Matrixin [Planctomycetota bacterium]